MELHEAVELIRPAIPASHRVWADLGAGSGTFTRALASILGPAGRVVAVDRDAAALATLRAELRGVPPDWAPIVVIHGDFEELPAIASSLGTPADGVLLANSLHFVLDAATLLGALASHMNTGGRIVVVEYDGRPANPWLPYPVPVRRLHAEARQAGFAAPRVVAERPSAYGGIMYCAVLEAHRPTVPPPP